MGRWQNIQEPEYRLTASMCIRGTKEENLNQMKAFKVLIIDQLFFLILQRMYIYIYLIWKNMNSK